MVVVIIEVQQSEIDRLYQALRYGGGVGLGRSINTASSRIYELSVRIEIHGS